MHVPVLSTPTLARPVPLGIVKDGPVPIYQQLKGLLLDAVAEGSLRPHQRIPSERELGAQLGVSRMTVRQALTQLIADGVLYARSGKGTFVSDRKIRQPLEHLSSFTEDMRARGMNPSTRILRQERRPADRDSAPLRPKEGTPIVVLERLRLADGEPIALECARLLGDRCPGLEEVDLARNSLYAVLRQRYGLSLTHAEQTIEAALPNAQQRTLLGIGPTDPVLHIERITYLDDGVPIEFVSSTYRGDRYRLQVDLKP